VDECGPEREREAGVIENKGRKWGNLLKTAGSSPFWTALDAQSSTDALIEHRHDTAVHRFTVSE